MNNFSTFYADAVKNKLKPIKRGKYKGQLRSVKSKDLPLPGPAYHAQPWKTDAPSASTYSLKG